MNRAAVYRNDEDFQRTLAEIKSNGGTRELPLVVGRLGGGILHFTDILFSRADASSIFAEVVDRDAEGIGPHFDVYSHLVDPDFPWIGVYNLAGSATLRSTVLPNDLSASYKQSFPNHDKSAYDARRNYSAIALQIGGDDVITHELSANDVFVLPQTVHGQPTVHEVTPRDPKNPGRFVKLFRGRDTTAAADARTSMGIDSLDTLVTECIGGNVNVIQDTVSEAPVPEPVVKRHTREPLLARATRRHRGGDSELLD